MIIEFHHICGSLWLIKISWKVNVTVHCYRFIKRKSGITTSPILELSCKEVQKQVHSNLHTYESTNLILTIIYSVFQYSLLHCMSEILFKKCNIITLCLWRIQTLGNLKGMGEVLDVLDQSGSYFFSSPCVYIIVQRQMCITVLFLNIRWYDYW